MKITYLTLSKNYSRKKLVEKDQLFEEIGWDSLIKDQTYSNTCAIRVSLALIKSGVPIQGRIPIKKGKFKGKFIEPGQAKLANQLATKAYLGKPKIFKPKDINKVVGNKHGIIVFWKIPGYSIGNSLGGHIDIISPSDGGHWECGSACYMDAAEAWFWELK